MGFFPALPPELAVAKFFGSPRSQEMEDLGFGMEETHHPVQQCTAGWVLEKGFSTSLKHLVLGAAGSVSQTDGISAETSVSAARKQIITTNSDVKQGKQVRRNMNVLLGEGCFIPVRTKIGCAFPIRKEN